MTEAPEEPHRDIVAFMSKDWDGELDTFNSRIVKDGTRGFCLLMNGEYVVHKGVDIDFAWVEHRGDDAVRLHPAHNTLMIN